MGGATAGSLITRLPDKPRTDGKYVLTVTINNVCNLKCSHCYLEYGSVKRHIDERSIEEMFSLNIDMVSIVGKEPLFDKTSIEIVEKIANIAYKKGIELYMITNGYNLTKLPQETIKKISNIDISYHGYSNTGIENYFQRVTDGARYAAKHTQTSLLAALADQTVNNIDRVIGFAKNNHFKKIYFSPFLHTHKPSPYTVNALDMADLFRILKENRLFMNTPDTYLLMDTYHIIYEGKYTSDEIDELIKMNDLGRKVIFHKTSPEDLGIIRLTLDGKVLHAFDALNTSTYHNKEIPIESFINRVFNDKYEFANN